MIFIKTKYYPLKSFNAITHWPFVFYKEDSKKMRNHERIHGEQQKETGLIGIIIATVLSLVFGFKFIFILAVAIFYVIYFVEWVLKGYQKISFEREAYKKEYNFDYLKNRKPFAWVNYVNRRRK